jgi:hypothetical protein
MSKTISFLRTAQIILLLVGVMLGAAANASAEEIIVDRMQG